MPYANPSYIELLHHAKRFSRRADEAEDLLQEILLASIEAGRSDLTCPENRRWMIGALRRRALFEARSAVRRKKRETDFVDEENESKDPQALPMEFVSKLPPSLRTVALLVLTGHTKVEIMYLLHLSDTAFRQRISGIRKRWQDSEGYSFDDFPGLDSSLPIGQIRRALLKPVKSEGAILASHDPDGNLFVLCSQKPMPRQPLSTTNPKKV